MMWLTVLRKMCNIFCVTYLVQYVRKSSRKNLLFLFKNLRIKKYTLQGRKANLFSTLPPEASSELVTCEERNLIELDLA